MTHKNFLMNISKMFYILANPEIVAEIQSFMQFDGQQWECKDCGYRSPMKHVVYNHIDSKHMDNMYPCNICGKSSSTQHSLKEHIRKQHKNKMSHVHTTYFN